MKRLLLAALLVAAFSASVVAEEKIDDDFDGLSREIRDQSDDNPALVVISLQVNKDLLGFRYGPNGVSFCKVQPVIGKRFVPARDLRVGGDQTLYFFDQVKVGEVYKLYDIAWSIQGFQVIYNHVVAPGIQGTDYSVNITKPGIYYLGSYIDNNGFTRNYEQSEESVLNALLPNLASFPNWTAAVEARLKELKK